MFFVSDVLFCDLDVCHFQCAIDVLVVIYVCFSEVLWCFDCDLIVCYFQCATDVLITCDLYVRHLKCTGTHCD